MNDDKCYSEGCVAQRQELAKLRAQYEDLSEKFAETCDLFIQEQQIRHEYGMRLAQLESKR